MEEVRYALLCDIAERTVGFCYQHFGTTYMIHFEWSKIQEDKNSFDYLTLENRIDVLSRNVGVKLQLCAA